MIWKKKIGKILVLKLTHFDFLCLRQAHLLLSGKYLVFVCRLQSQMILRGVLHFQRFQKKEDERTSQNLSFNYADGAIKRSSRILMDLFIALKTARMQKGFTCSLYCFQMRFLMLFTLLFFFSFQYFKICWFIDNNDWFETIPRTFNRTYKSICCTNRSTEVIKHWW